MGPRSVSVAWMRSRDRRSSTWVTLHRLTARPTKLGMPSRASYSNAIASRLKRVSRSLTTPAFTGPKGAMLHERVTPTPGSAAPTGQEAVMGAAHSLTCMNRSPSACQTRSADASMMISFRSSMLPALAPPSGFRDSREGKRRATRMRLESIGAGAIERLDAFPHGHPALRAHAIPFEPALRDRWHLAVHVRARANDLPSGLDWHANALVDAHRLHDALL
jgi:hypothetical protein